MPGTNRPNRGQAPAFEFPPMGPSFADKDEYFTKNLRFDISAVTFDENGGYKNEPRWRVDIENISDNRPPEILTFGCNEQRDTIMESMVQYIANHGFIVSASIRKLGRAYVIAPWEARTQS